MTIRPSLQKAIALAISLSTDGRVSLSTLVYPQGGRRCVDLVIGSNGDSRRFFVLSKRSLDEAKEASANVLDETARLIESLGGTANL